MAFTTWSTTDLVNVTLSGGNLIATASAINGGVRGKDPKRSGKFYIEYTSTTTQNAASGVGFAARGPGTLGNSSLPMSAKNTASPGNLLGFDNFGTQAFTVNAVVTMTTGTVVCFAIDLDNRLIWIRSGAAGNWNGSASNNPATGVGGQSLAAVGLGQGIDCYPYAYFGSSANSVTLNAGASAFTGSVPSGFTSGWDDSVAAVSYAVATQLGIEEWAGASSPVQAWLTQIAVEEWASAQLYAPPVTSDPNFANVVLLCHCDGTAGSSTFTDVSASNHFLLASLTSVNATAKFGTGAAFFSSGSANITASGTLTDFNFGAGQFTVEAWGYYTGTPGTVSTVMGQWQGSSNLGWTLAIVSGSLGFYYSTTGTDNPNVGAAFSPTLNTWYHLAADRDASNVLRVYVNGAVIGSATVASTFFASTLSLFIGNDGNAGRVFTGLLDDIRITKGVARYAGAFLPPSTAFPGPAVTTQARAWIMA